MRPGLLVGTGKKFIFGSSLILILSATGGASANEASKSLDSPRVTGSPAGQQPAAVSVQPGPLASERMALLTRIEEAKEKGVGVQAYMTAFLDAEGMVGKGASPENIRTRLDSLNTALDKQLSSSDFKAKNLSTSTTPTSDTGIIGLKFKISPERPAIVFTVFPDGPAAIAQLRARDIIMQVDGRPTTGLDKEHIYGMLVGKPATKVKLTIRRGANTFVKTLTRMRAKDFAKIHPDIWRKYLSTM